MDRRITPFSGEVADIALTGLVAARAFVSPEPRMVTGNPFLLATPGGARDRQLLCGDRFGLIEEREGWAFGQSAKDGYCGWLPSEALVAPEAPTHRVAVRSTWLYPEPSARVPAVLDLHCNGHVTWRGETGAWAEVTAGGVSGFVPAAHLAPMDAPETDPTRVLRLFQGTPYVWAGNTGFGIDCSGLVQAALHACGRPCPGDSDLQEAALGARLMPGVAPRPGDLYFWTGHVAMVVEPGWLLHANGHAMSVAWEDIDSALVRIAAAGERLLSVRRL